MAKLLKKKIFIPSLPLKQCIAKTKDDGTPGMTVKEHSKITGYVAKIFRKVLPPFVRKILIPNIASVVSMHDIGKISLWQKKIYKEFLENISPELFKIPDNAYERYHAVISEAAFRDAFHNTAENKTIDQYASMLGSHHGRRTQKPAGSEVDTYGGPNWKFIREELIRYCVKEFGHPIFRPLSQEAADINTGYLSLCDWISSDSKMFQSSGNIRYLHKKILGAIRALGWKKVLFVKDLHLKISLVLNPMKCKEISIIV